ncbi:MAG: metal-dependent transcriptional regulator [Crocinitomicaceae bacterium]|nr:metal-dependent transcriptional regulator [Crocinitomicaceae bacterium]
MAKQEFLSHSEENYLKVIFQLAGQERLKVSTNALADKLCAKPSSITDMLKKLSDKKLISYKKYQGCGLTVKGEVIAIQIIRKHRLWETFLVSKLSFGWEEVHDVAEQLEHIQSIKLIDKLDEFLDFPKFDPHGDPIPDRAGNITYRKSKIKLAEAAINAVVEVVSVDEDSPSLLKYLDEIGLRLGSRIKVFERIPFDSSLKIEIVGVQKMYISEKVADNIGVRFIEKL